MAARTTFTHTLPEGGGVKESAKKLRFQKTRKTPFVVTMSHLDWVAKKRPASPDTVPCFLYPLHLTSMFRLLDVCDAQVAFMNTSWSFLACSMSVLTCELLATVLSQCMQNTQFFINTLCKRLKCFSSKGCDTCSVTSQTL